MEFKTAEVNISRLVDKMLEAALTCGASDIHIEVLEKESRIRFRVDGLLREYATLPKQRHSSLVSKLKIMGGMDIGEQRLPQDGRWHVLVRGREIDLRLSSLPGIFGEKVVIRILDSSKQLLNLEELDFSPENFRLYKQLYSQANGLVLVTGPTGSGKSTTLYATLSKLNKQDVNITTLEDPVEYTLPGINQVSLNEKAGLTFDKGLRAIVRQDPDIIMVGEIRDKVTAEMAVQAALTGHLVFSTLHTNNAVGAVNRLLDIGIAPFLVASALRGVISQRLVRAVCPHCQQLRTTTFMEKKYFQLYGQEAPEQVVEGVGCENCGGTGYRGRLAVHEVFAVNESISKMIFNKLEEQKIANEARNSGLKCLQEDGLAKVRAGRTTIAELVRLAILEEDTYAL